MRGVHVSEVKVTSDDFEFFSHLMERSADEFSPVGEQS
jgi:hypothetical protein